MYKLEDGLHTIVGSGTMASFRPERRPSESPAKRQKPIEFIHDEYTNKLDPSFLSLWSPHSGVLDNNLTGAKASSVVPVSLPLLAMMESRTPTLPAKRKTVLKYFRDGEDMRKVDPSFLSLWSPRSGVSDKNSTSLEVPRTRPCEDSRLPGEAAMDKLPSTMMVGREEQAGISPGTPPLRAFECKTCGKRFSTCQALGGHTTGHMRSDGGQKSSSTRPATATETRRHECSICSRCFSSGQALGGHKRLHRDKDMGKLQGKQIGARLLGISSMGSDLNQPPPQ